MAEKDLINQVLLSYTENGNRLFRQNTGVAWAGAFYKSPMKTTVTINPEDVVVRNARMLRAGLCRGSSDLVGWRRLTITPEMIGQTIAQFSAIEVKYGRTKTTAEQINFIEQVNKSGGHGKIIYSLEDLLNG